MPVQMASASLPVIKVLKEEFPSKETLAQLENEFEIMFKNKMQQRKKSV